MEYIVVVCLFAAFVIAESLIGRKKRKERVLKEIRASWGSKPDNEYDERDFQRFAEFYRSYLRDRSRFTIDDITWNDLELDRLYAEINCTHTSMGDELLYAILRTPVFGDAVLEERKNLVAYWSDHDREREAVQMELEMLGKFNGKGPSILLRDSDSRKLRNPWLYKIMTFIPFTTIPFFFIHIGFGLLLLVVSAGINILYHERVLKEVDQKMPAVTSAISVISLGGRLANLDLPEFGEQTTRLKSLYDSLSPVVRKGSPIRFVNKNALAAGDMLGGLSEIPKMILLTSLWSYDACVSFLYNNRERLAELIALIGTWDVTMCVASYRKRLVNWCIPEFVPDRSGETRFLICADNVRHPMVENCIGNPVRVDKPVLLTGSNASGKSTYLKTVAINTLFAHTLLTCLADRWASVPLFPITSIALRDSTVNGESYFVAEIKSLRRIFNTVNPDVRCLCIVDEVLRGTNTIERIAASSHILMSLARLNVCVFAATHDVELTDILGGVYDNRHFEETVSENDIVFDYRLKEGCAMSRNAIKLLGLMGFDQDMIRKCLEAVRRFEETRRWDV
jgi:DNA mismatch repair ATPase MutS